jgi:hypothetical protein
MQDIRVESVFIYIRMGSVMGFLKNVMKFQFDLSMTLGIPNIAQDRSILTLRRLMSYIYGAPILDVSRSHTTAQHSR